MKSIVTTLAALAVSTVLVACGKAPEVVPAPAPVVDAPVAPAPVVDAPAPVASEPVKS